MSLQTFSREVVFVELYQYFLFQGDYFALELVSGLLYLHLSLAGDTVKFRARRSSALLSDGEWHKVCSSLI